MDFDGNDAIRLSLASTTKDIIGQIGTDPGTEWLGGGVSTANQSLGLMVGLTTGDADGADAYDPSIRYNNLATASVDAASMRGFGMRPDELAWDNNGTGQASGGAGTWNTTDSRWTADNTSSTPTYVAWNNAGTSRYASFSGAGGHTVTLAEGITIDGITFHSSGYDISENTLTLGSTDTIFNVWNSGHIAHINSIVAGPDRNLVKTGAGALVLSEGNTYTGSTIVEAGTLRLGGVSDVIADTSNVSLGGGTLAVDFSAIGLFSDTVGSLSLSASSIIDMKGPYSSHLTFAGIGSWTGTLSVYNWTGTINTPGGDDRLLFTSTATPPGAVQFYSDRGTTPIGSGAAFSGSELVPVPEPGAVMAALFLMAPVAWRERRYFLRCRAEPA